MEIIRTTQELINWRKTLSGSVGFVPTMGALHQGHLSLIKKAKADNEYLIVSIFVNPTQFLEGEDLDAYPRKEEADREICRFAGVDVIFMPTVDTIYERDELRILAPSVRGYILEGQKRAGHFDGMLQVVMKLLNITTPTNAYFGKKDAQQLSLITQMVKNYFMRVNIIACDIIRDENGLALSSRNIYLTPDEKTRALALSRSLQRATKMIIAKELNTKTIKNSMREILQDIEKIDYIAIVDREFNHIDEIKIGNSIILVAGWVGKTRLIDNMWV